MAFFDISFAMRNQNALYLILDNLIEALERDPLFHIYSTGANQGSGNYEFYVQSERLQAWMHQGWWHTEEQTIDAQDERIAARLDDALQMLADGNRYGSYEQFVTEVARDLLGIMREYPAERPGSQYQRTYTLFDSWQVDVSA